MCKHTNTTIGPQCTRLHAHIIRLHRNEIHKTRFFGMYMNPRAHDGTATSGTQPRTTQKYEQNGTGCIIFIPKTVEMPQSYTVATFPDYCYHSLDNHWRYGSLICITTLIIQIRVQYLNTFLYWLHSGDSAAVHYSISTGPLYATLYYIYW